MTDIIYKVQRIKDGKFSNGGSSPSFTANGKSWSTLGQLKSHLRMLKFTPELYDGCKIVEFELVKVDTEPFSLEEHITAMKEDKVAAKLAGKRHW